MAEMHSCSCCSTKDAAPAKVKDPVCGMIVDPATAKHRTTYAGKEYCFCRAGCREKFEADPETYVAKAAEAEAPATVKDPVCGMTVDPATAKHRTMVEGKPVYFCSGRCKEKFEAEPRKYLAEAVAAPKPVSDVPAGTIYTCPMDPEIRQVGPGTCPICGMALEPEMPGEAEGPNPELVDFKRRLWMGGALTAPVFLLEMGGHLVDLHRLISPSTANWVELVLASPVVLWAGAPFFVRGWRSLVSRNLNMFTLIALGTGVAYVYSLVATLAPGLFPPAFRGHDGAVAVYFEAAAVITVLVLFGQVLELSARERTGGAIRALIDLAPKQARRVGTDGAETDVPLESVAVGDRLRVRPGGESAGRWDASRGSQRARRVARHRRVPPGDEGERRQGRGRFAEPVRRLRHARRQGRPRHVAFADRADGRERPALARADPEARRSRRRLVRAARRALRARGLCRMATFGPSPRFAFALVAAVSVLIIACPCALGLATPMSIMVGVGRGAQAGVLVRNAEALERFEAVDTIVLDKTGTLTEGKPKVTALVPAEGLSETDLLRLAASVERASEHPLAAALVRAAQERGLALADAADFDAPAGKGVTGTVDGRRVAVGNRAFLEGQGASLGTLADEAERLRGEGATAVFVAVDGRAAGVVGIADPVKASTVPALEALRSDGLRIVMLTGDHRTTAQAVARRLGITEIEAEVLPEDKAKVVERLRKEGRHVAMVGDGVNDAPALAAAEVGIAMGTGTDVAMESAGLTLVGGDLAGLVRARHLSKAVMSNIRQNLVFAFLYNGAGVPIAAGVLYPVFGILLSPVIAAAAMALSSVSVIGNALRLRGVKLG